MSNELNWGSTLPAEAEKKEFELPPVGEYDFIVAEVKKTYSSNGNPMATVRMELRGFTGSVFDNLVLTDGMVWKLNQFFECLGIKEKKKELTISLSDAFDKAVGAEGRLSVKHETYNGKQTVRVKEYIMTTAKAAPTAPSSDFVPPFEID